VDWPGSNPKALLEARRTVEKAIKIEPTSVFAHVALGGVAARLGDFSGALEVLLRAQAAEQRQGFKRSVSLQRNYYYAGLAYVGLKRAPEAKAQFVAVIAYVEKWGHRSISNRQLAQFARLELDRL
jgi:lipopolysaccharide biosynthesis regulator YciM